MLPKCHRLTGEGAQCHCHPCQAVTWPAASATRSLLAVTGEGGI